MDSNLNNYMDFVTDLDEKINMEEHIFVYDGIVDQELTKVFANKVNNILESKGIDFLVAKRIYHIMIECFQNINRHSDPPPEKIENFDGVRGYLSVGKDKENYFVTTGNYIDRAKVDVLKKRIDIINLMSKDEIKNLYKQSLREGELGEKGGAGLGFIDMKKRTQQDIGYKFKELTENTSFVVLCVQISAI